MIIKTEGIKINNKILKNRFENYAENKNGISGLQAEMLLKELGINITRKTLSTLSKKGIIKAPEIVNDGATDNGRRVLYDLKSIMQAIAYKLAVEVSCLKGRLSESRLEYFTYANVATDEFLEKDADIKVSANMASMGSASFFVDKKLKNNEKLEAAKEVQRQIFKILVCYWFAKRLVHSNGNCDIVTAWGKIREFIFNGTSLKRFSTKLRTDISEKNCYVDVFEHIQNVSVSLEEDLEAKAAMKTWLEILMIFTCGTPLIVAEAEVYMKMNYGIRVDLHSDTMLSVINLYKLIK